MSEKFEQISLKPGFMKHNGGVMFRSISDSEYEFKSSISENHLNAAGITHGGYLSALVDAGAGTAAHRSADKCPCVTISLELKFISAVKLYQVIIGRAKVQKKNEVCEKNVQATCPKKVSIQIFEYIQILIFIYKLFKHMTNLTIYK